MQIIVVDISFYFQQTSTLLSPITEQTLTDETEAIETENSLENPLRSEITEAQTRIDVALIQTIDPSVYTSEERTSQQETGALNCSANVDVSTSNVQGPTTSGNSDRKRKVSVFSTDARENSTAKRIALFSQIEVRHKFSFEI